MNPHPITLAMVPAWARGLSADVDDDGDEDGEGLEDASRLPRGRRRKRIRRH